MDTILTKNELFEIRDEMAKLGREIDNFRISNSTKISAFLFSELENWSRLIKDRVFELTGKDLNQLKTDIKQPAANLQKAINQLKDALKTIETFNEAVNYIADIINTFGVIVRAASQGLDSANIASAFESLENLLGVA